MKIEVQVTGKIFGHQLSGESVEQAKARIALTAEMNANRHGDIRMHLSLAEDPRELGFCRHFTCTEKVVAEGNSNCEKHQPKRPPANLCKECGASEQDPEKAKCVHCRRQPLLKIGDVIGRDPGETSHSVKGNIYQEEKLCCRVCGKTPPKGITWKICDECYELRENITISNYDREMVLKYRLNGFWQENFSKNNTLLFRENEL